MPDSIIDGTGTSKLARVDTSNRLTTRSITTSDQNYISRIEKSAYQVSSQINIGTSESPVLFLKNDDRDRYIVVTYIRVMTAGAAITNENAYFTIYLGGSYVSGGAAVTPVNMYAGTGLVAEATSYSGSTALNLNYGNEIDRYYEANEMESYRKEGSIILPTGSAIHVNHKGSTAAGIAYCRISFYFIDKGDP